MSFTLIAIGSALLASVANILARTLLRQVKAREILGINFLTMGATLVLLSPFFYFFKADLVSFALVVAIALIDTVANYFYFKTFEKTEASVATPLLSLAPAFAFLFGWLIIADVVNRQTYVLAFAIIALVVIFSADFKDFKNFKTSTLIPALVSSILFGLSAIPSKYLLSDLQAINAPTLYMFRAGFIALFSLLFFRFPINALSFSQFRTIFIRGLFVIGQWILLYYALTVGSVGVTITLANITPIFVFILGIVFLREKVMAKKIIAALLILFLSLII
ncbi:MAG: DMT family transporter [Patescibacteria group bacterium]|jgi:drug/metabolite transporter (DMT)-like permease